MLIQLSNNCEVKFVSAEHHCKLEERFIYCTRDLHAFFTLPSHTVFKRNCTIANTCATFLKQVQGYAESATLPFLDWQLKTLLTRPYSWWDFGSGWSDSNSLTISFPNENLTQNGWKFTFDIDISIIAIPFWKILRHEGNVDTVENLRPYFKLVGEQPAGHEWSVHQLGSSFIYGCGI